MGDLETLTAPLLDWDGLLTPIPGAYPSGPPLRNQPPYEELREALRPPDTAPGGVWQRDQKPVDYAAVTKMATQFLATQSKDLDVAVWLAEALTRQHQLNGMCEGLLLIRKLLETFWESIHPALDPEDLEAFRAKPLKRLNTIFVVPFQAFAITSDGRSLRDYSTSKSDGEPKPEDMERSVVATSFGFYESLSEAIERARKAISELQAVFDRLFTTPDHPHLEKLKDQLDGLQNTVKAIVRSKPAPPPVVTLPPAIPAAPDPPPTKAPEVAVASAPTPAPVEQPPARTVLEMAVELRAVDAANPVPYMLVRSWAFGPMLAHGSPVTEDLLEPPPTEVRTALRRAVLAQDWWEALDRCEHAMALPCGACWLDIQQHAYRACKELAHQGAAHAIRGMVAGYLHALPDLMSAVMLDGSPTATPDTIAWLRNEVLVDPQQTRQESLDEVRTLDLDREREIFEGKPPDAFEVAAAELSAGRFGEAFRVLSEALAREQSGRGRMQRKLQLAKISVEAGQHGIALPILREVYQTIEERHLDSWEAADVVAPPLGMLYHCLENVNDSTGFKQRVYEKLCAIDPMKAWELSPKA